MAALGPFEDSPVLGLAVSGGADSLALTYLTHDWAVARGGRVIGLSVDHGLRPEAAAECRQVADWLGDRGIEHHILVRRGPAWSSGIQAAARQARYRLLTDWCRQNGVLHLLLAHHRDDQVETFLMRLERGSGLDGLAGMSALTSFAGVRLLRPLLAVPKSSLIELLNIRSQPWIDDPSNRDATYRRSHLRRRLAERTAADLAAMARTARSFGLHRRAVSAMTADLAAATVELHAAGYAHLALTPFRTAPAAIRRRLLGRLLMCVGGASYPPRADRLAALDSWLTEAGVVKGRTLAGCRLLPQKQDHLLVCREVGRLSQTVNVLPGTAARWDRFAVRVGSAKLPPGRDQFHVRRLGADGWRQIAETACTMLPKAVRGGLPSLWCGDRLLAVPHIAFDCPKTDTEPAFSAVFDPSQPLVSVGFMLA